MTKAKTYKNTTRKNAKSQAKTLRASASWLGIAFGMKCAVDDRQNDARHKKIRRLGPRSAFLREEDTTRPAMVASHLERKPLRGYLTIDTAGREDEKEDE